MEFPYETIIDDIQPDTNRQELAETLFIHGALTQFYDKDQVARERRIQHVLQKIDFAAPSQGLRRWKRSITILAIAAGVLIALGIWNTQMGSNEAAAKQVLHLAQKSASKPVDRHYQVKIETNRGLTTADLYLRGEQGIVFQMPALVGSGSLWMGYDAANNQAWLVPALRLAPVLVSNEPQAIEAVIDHLGLSYPLLNFSAFLKNVPDRYQLESLPNQLQNGVESKRILAVKPDTVDSLLLDPDQVELWFDPKTEVVTRLQLRWGPQNSNQGDRQIEFLLLDQDSRPSDWLKHEVHHDPNRPVVVRTRFVLE